MSITVQTHDRDALVAAAGPDPAADAVLTLDADGRILDVNDVAVDLFACGDASVLTGRDATEVVGFPVESLPAGLPARAGITRADATPVPVQVARHRLGNGSVLVVRVMCELQLGAEAQGMFDAVFENTPMATAMFNTDGYYIRANDNLCTFLGRDREELFAHRDQEYTHPDDRASDLEAVALIFAGHTDRWLTEKRFVRPDGSIVWAIANLTFLRDEAGIALGWVGQFQDITSRKHAEQQLRDRETELVRARHHAEAIVTAMGEGYALTIDGRISAVNDAMCRITGFTRDDLVGSEMPFPFLPADQLARLQETGDRIADAGSGTFDIVLQRADKTRFDAEVTSQGAYNADGSLLGFVHTIRDVSQRKRYEAELERERRDLQTAQALARVGSWEYELSGTGHGRWSRELWRLAGLDPRPTPPPLHELEAIVHREDRERLRDRLTRGLSNAEAFQEEFTIVHGDGQESRLAVRAEFSIDEHGVAVASGTVQDITERAQRDREQLALREIAELVANGAEPQEVFSLTARHARDVFRAYGGVVAEFDLPSRTATLVSGWRVGDTDISGALLSLDAQSAVTEAFRTGQPARYDSPHPGDRPYPQTDSISAVAAPVIVHGRLWGAIGAHFTDRLAPDGAEQQLARFAGLVGMAIGNTEAWETLSREARTDALTGLANRRTFIERLRAEVKHAQRAGRSCSLVMFDIDHFKRINDTHGHPVGDGVLVEFAARMAEGTRGDELLARLGGEEFALLLPDAESHGALRAAERLRTLVEVTPFGHVGSITISAGVCTTADAASIEAMLTGADRALYEAKRSGRNRSVLYVAAGAR